MEVADGKYFHKNPFKYVWLKPYIKLYIKLCTVYGYRYLVA